MALMFAVVYKDQVLAEQALSMAKSLESAGYARIFDQALIRKDEHGTARIDEEKHPIRRGAVTGGVVGGILGAFFLAPVAGAAAGAALGGVIGHSEQSGAQDFKSFAEKVTQEIPNGGAAVVLMGDTDARERVVHDLGSFGGTVHSLDLKAEELAQLQREMNRAMQ